MKQQTCYISWQCWKILFVVIFWGLFGCTCMYLTFLLSHESVEWNKQSIWFRQTCGNRLKERKKNFFCLPITRMNYNRNSIEFDIKIWPIIRQFHKNAVPVVVLVVKLKLPIHEGYTVRLFESGLCKFAHRDYKRIEGAMAAKIGNAHGESNGGQIHVSNVVTRPKMAQHGRVRAF